jgi:hypothetical protein
LHPVPISIGLSPSQFIARAMRPPHTAIRDRLSAPSISRSDITEQRQNIIAVVTLEKLFSTSPDKNLGILGISAPRPLTNRSISKKSRPLAPSRAPEIKRLPRGKNHLFFAFGKP